jgi:hypothetical protein
MSALHSIALSIADIRIDLTSPLSAAELGIEYRLGPFVGAPEDPLARVALRWEESLAPPTPRGDLIYDPGSIWKMYRDGTDTYAAMTYANGGRAARPQSVLRANPGWDDLVLSEQRTSPKWQSLLNVGAGELLLRTAILFTGGLLFHSSGLDDNGKGIVFIGHSGVGKSTQLDLWSRQPGVIAMNDDRVAVRMQSGGASCYGVPWSGKADVARNHTAPLTALILLEQAPENAIQRMAPAAAAPALAACAFLPYWDSSLMQLAMSSLNALIERVPVYRLRCRPETAVIPLVRSVL